MQVINPEEKSMPENIEIVKKLNQAFDRRDSKAFRALLHDSYTFRGPMMQFSSADEAAAFMSQCPMRAHNENVTFISESGRVVQAFDWKVTEPFQKTIRMCEILTLKEGKVVASELFYDSAQFPEEAKAEFEKMKAQKA